MMVNPFTLIDEKLSNLIGLVLELVNKLQAAANSPLLEEPMDIEEAAKFLRTPVSTIYSFVSDRESKFPSHKPGKHLLFYKSELNEWVKASRKKTAAEIRTEARKGVRRGY